MRLVQNKLGNESHSVEKGLMTRAAALINIGNSTRASKIVDHGTSGNFQSIRNTLGVLESTRFQLSKPVTIGMGSGDTVARHGALVEDCAPLQSDPNVGVVLLNTYLFPHPWRPDLSLMSPAKMLRLGVSVCSQNMASFPPYLLSRNTYSNDKTTHDDVGDLPSGTVATKLVVAANGLMLFGSHQKSAFGSLVSALVLVSLMTWHQRFITSEYPLRVIHSNLITWRLWPRQVPEVQTYGSARFGSSSSRSDWLQRHHLTFAQSSEIEDFVSI
mmetsp:Transcript_31994/g.98740  ORF Transcript_31994/g.98740 Transcript_31994/m.98740 type:complete len:272 (+) Transcript_31994:781-1596(+)